MQTEAIPADLPDLKLINNAKGVEGDGSRFKIFHVMLVFAQLHKGELPAPEYPTMVCWRMHNVQGLHRTRTGSMMACKWHAWHHCYPMIVLL
jgi:hypothetical protein